MNIELTMEQQNNILSRIVGTIVQRAGGRLDVELEDGEGGDLLLYYDKEKHIMRIIIQPETIN
jgi:hypothetical protein